MNTTRNESYQDGYARGKEMVSIAMFDSPRDYRTRDELIEESYEIEDNDRQFSPFEFTARRLSELDEWDDFEAGLSDGINAAASTYFPTEDE